MSTAPPRFARPFVALFLTALVACPLAGINPWPFSNWQLFSRLRSDQVSTWAAAAVGRTGRGRSYRFRSSPGGHRGFERTMAHFSERSVAGRNALCTEWLRGAVEQLGPSAQTLRIYRLTWRLSARRGERAAPPTRTLVWTCGSKGARAAS